jgi:hypothetical protein
LSKIPLVFTKPLAVYNDHAALLSNTSNVSYAYKRLLLVTAYFLSDCTINQMFTFSPPLMTQDYFDRRNEAKSQLSLTKATISKVEVVGMGDRVCVDLCSIMRPGEGLLVCVYPSPVSVDTHE